MNLTKITEEEYAHVSGADILENKNRKDHRDTELLELFCYWLDYAANRLRHHDYRSVSDCMRKKKYTTVFYSKEDIKNLSISMGMYENHPDFKQSGVFLSYLINQHYKKNKTGNTPEQKNISENESCEKNQKRETANDKYEIITEHFSEEIDQIGLQNNGPNIRVLGNAGKHLGSGMINGSIYLTGNADLYLGAFMKGGEISVQDAAGNVGFVMEKGTIYIRRDMHGLIGENMEGGTIHIEGKIHSSLSLEEIYEKIRDEIGKGEVYHKNIKIKHAMTYKDHKIMQDACKRV